MSEKFVTDPRIDLKRRLAVVNASLSRGLEWDSLEIPARIESLDWAEGVLNVIREAGLDLVDLNPENPHSSERTRRLTDVWAMSLHTLSTAVEKRNGLRYASDVQRIIDDVSSSSRALAGIVDCCTSWLKAEHEAGRLKLDRKGLNQNAEARLQAVVDALDNTVRQTTELYEAAEAARTELSPFASKEIF